MMRSRALLLVAICLLAAALPPPRQVANSYGTAETATERDAVTLDVTLSLATRIPAPTRSTLK